MDIVLPMSTAVNQHLVVYVVKGQAEAEAIREEFVGDKHVRVIWPAGASDRQRVQPLYRLTGGLGVIGDLYMILGRDPLLAAGLRRPTRLL
ncbi:hypothetical protein [Streptomyces sp. NPDC093970]|uniref:hypothetical protein n=1 Tax=Streptomyces sp. NPDC093970 TaxID=3155076 RepID=UPI0034473F90